LEELEEQLPALIEEMTEQKSSITEIGDPAFKSSFYTRRPNPEGILHVVTRLAKKIKEGLD
jgi:ubiquinol-cytochrome c reductase cytochrome b subunit